MIQIMDRHLKIATYLADLLDTKYKVGKLKFGLDPVLGLIPGLGDLIPALLGLYIVGIGIRMELPNEKVAAMVANLFVDFVLSVIPVVGDVSDFIFKANTKNLEIINDHLKKKDTPEKGRLLAN
jgi:hypothetical protein